MNNTTTEASMFSPEEIQRILSSLNLDAIAGASGMFGVPGATSSTITNPYTPAYVFNPDVSLVGATDIFGGRTYESPLATPSGARVGYSEMLKLNQAPGYVATNRPEQIGDMYLPYRPSGEGAQVADDIKTWYEYYTDNEDFRKFLSADEQTELAWLDYRNKRYTQEAFTKKINDIRSQFNLPQKVGFKDFEAHFSYGTKRKKYSDNPYADLQQYGPSIGGYWNPENDPSDFQKAMANPLVGAVATTLGATLGGPLGAALASGAASKLSGADWRDALTSAAIAGGSSYLGGKLSPTTPSSEFNIPGLDVGAAPVTGFNKSLIEQALLSPTAASAIANPAFNLASPSFFQTALGQGLSKAGLTLLGGGDIKDVLAAGLLGSVGGPGGALSNPLSSLGADFGQNALGQALNNLSIADAVKFGLKLPKDQWSAVGSLFGDLDLGAISDYGAFDVLPKAVQTALGNVKLSDVLENIGGVDYGSLLNIASDVKLPNVETGLFSGLGLNLPNAPDWFKNLYTSGQDIFSNLPDINFGNLNIPDINLGNLNIPDINVPNLAIPEFNIPSLDLGSLNIPNFDFPSISTTQASARQPQGYSSSFLNTEEYQPFTAKLSYDPRLQPLTPIAPSDPLSVLLAEFYKT